MTEDYFWGVTLDGNTKEYKWEPDALKENGAAGDISLTAKGEHGLILKQALLGHESKDGEVNKIEVETTGFKGESVKLPIVTLMKGVNCFNLLDLNFPDPPVTLKLVEGSGPVHLCGNHVINSEPYNDDDDDEDDEDMEDFDDQGLEEEDEEEEKTGSKKRTNSTPPANLSRKKKKSMKDE